MTTHISVFCPKVIVFALILFTATTYGQKVPNKCRTEGVPQRAPKYLIGDSWRTEIKTPTLDIQISIKPRYFNQKDMMALARQLKEDFCNEQRLFVFIFDSNSSARAFAPIPHSPTYDRDFKALRGFYELDRVGGKEYIQFSSSRDKPRDEINIKIDGNPR